MKTIKKKLGSRKVYVSEFNASSRKWVHNFQMQIKRKTFCEWFENIRNLDKKIPINLSRYKIIATSPNYVYCSTSQVSDS